MAQVDVIMSVRDGERFLPEALDSLAAQTFKGFRLVAVDDASSDRTLNILETERRFETRILKNETRRGLAGSLNLLLDQPTEAIYYARFDPDDVCEPQRLAEQVAFMEGAPEVGIVGAWATVIDERGDVTGAHDYPKTDPEIRFEMCFRCPLLHPVTTMRRAVVNRHHLRYSVAYRCEDYEYWCRLLEVTQAHNLEIRLLKYRRHAQAVGVSNFEQQETDFERVRREWVMRQFRDPRLEAVLRTAFENKGMTDEFPAFGERIRFCQHLQAWMKLNQINTEIKTVRDRLRQILINLSKDLSTLQRFALCMQWPFRLVLLYNWSGKILRRMGMEKNYE